MEEISKILPAVLRRHARRDRPPVVEMLAPLWSQVAGEAIAAQSRPVAFEAGRLTLATACPTWAAQLAQLQGQILAAINAFLGRTLVKELRVRVVAEAVVTQTKAAAAIAANESQAAAANLPAPPALRDSRLDAEIARVLAQSYSKYFSRARGTSPEAKTPDSGFQTPDPEGFN